MSDPERLEVLMAVHASDRPNWLRQALDSLHRQTRPADSVRVVVDGPISAELAGVLDAAPDGLGLERLELTESRGLGAALAAGMAASDACLIARMDADDLAAPQRFERQLAALAVDPQLCVVGSWAALMDEEGEPSGLRRMPVEDADIRRHVWSNPFVHSSVMFRRAAVASVGGYDPALTTRQDYDLWFRCVAGNLRMANLPEPLLHYRVAARGKHRRLGVVWRQVRTGWRGCRLVGAPLHARIGVAAPLLLALLPEALGRWLRRRLKFAS